MKSIKKLERATGLEPARRGGPATGIEILRATLTLRPHKQLSYNVNYRRVGIHAHGYLIFVRFGFCSKMVSNKCPPYAESGMMERWSLN
jgi:hypothetical protein